MRFVLLMSITLFACGNQPAHHSSAYQIIIGFSHNTDPRDPALIQSLSAQLDATLQFIRTLSGHAAVYRLQSQLPRTKVAEKLQQLNQRDDIRYAEFDQRQNIYKP